MLAAMLDLFTPAVTFDEAAERQDVASYFGGKPGIFVDVGANEPKDHSQTWHLEQKGWRGILVEPVREYSDKLRAERTARVFNVACGAPEQHGRVLPLKVLGALSTLADNFREPGMSPSEVRLIPVVTLNSILSGAGIEKIDFLSIDVEGFEIEVLKGFFIEKHRPALLLVEDHARGWSLHRYLIAHGYKRVRRTCLNSWYVPQEVEFPMSLFGRLQMFRKFVLGVPFRVMKFRWQHWRGGRRG